MRGLIVLLLFWPSAVHAVALAPGSAPSDLFVLDCFAPPALSIKASLLK